MYYMTSEIICACHLYSIVEFQRFGVALPRPLFLPSKKMEVRIYLRNGGT